LRYILPSANLTASCTAALYYYKKSSENAHNESTQQKLQTIKKTGNTKQN
jgi:hypothetical protein